MDEIIELDIKNFEKCNNIWNMEKNKELKDRFYKELLSKNRVTFVYTKDVDNYIALKLYVNLGFTKIQYIGEDTDGKYVKLIKSL